MSEKLLKRRRKQSRGDESANAFVTKSKQLSAFDAVKFRSMLKNVDTVFLALEEFADAANGYPDYTDTDIVKDYIDGSLDCAELFNIIDGKTLKPSEIAKVFHVFESILIRTGDDLADKYSQLGENIVNHLTNVNTKLIYVGLYITNKPNQLKITVRLLTAMVLQGDNSAMAVLDLFDDKNQNCLSQLFEHKNIMDPQDVRTCVIHFILSFLLTGSNQIARLLLKKTVLVQNVFYGISEDKSDLIEIVLQVFQEKVIENPGISKTLKIAVFNARILKELSQVYYWTVPRKWKESKDKKTIDESGSEEERKLVVDLIHKFLLILCCSFKHGIAFLDRTVGTGKKNHNIVLKNWLASLNRPHQHPILKQLVIQVLKECPDLLRHYLPSYNHILVPKYSTDWMKCMDFILEIYDNQTTTPNLSNIEDLSMSKLETIVMIYIMPPDILIDTISAGIKNHSLSVRHKIMEMYTVIVNKAIIMRDHVKTIKDDNSKICWKDLPENITEITLKDAPVLNNFMSCWNKAFTSKTDTEPLSEIQPITIIEHLILLEKYLSLNQQLVPDLLIDHPHILTALLTGVNKLTESLVGEDTSCNDDVSHLHVHLLQILAGTDAGLLTWKKKDKKGKTIMHQLLGMLTRLSSVLKTSRHLICELLQTSGYFMEDSNELIIWLKQVPANNDHTSTELNILAKILNRFINNADHYLYKQIDIIKSEMELGEVELTRSIASADDVIEAILAMDDKDLDSIEGPGIKNDVLTEEMAKTDFRVALSPLIVVTMEMIKGKDENDEELKSFLSIVLPQIFHVQIEPDHIRLVLNYYRKLLKGDKSVKYIKTWKPCPTINTVSHMLMSLPYGTEVLNTDYKTEITSELVTIETDDLLLISQQLILYIGEAIVQFPKDQKANKKKIKFYFGLLLKILSMFEDKMEEDEPKDKNKTLVRESYLQQAGDKAQILNYILRNPYIKQLFMYTEDTQTGLVDETSLQLTAIITPLLLKIKENGSGCLEELRELKALKHSYADKIVQKLDKVSTVNTNLIVKCFMSLLPFLEKEYQTRFLHVILTLEDSTILVDLNTCSFTEIGQHVVSLLTEMLEDSEPFYKKLSLQHMSVILNCLAHVSDKNLIKLCLDILNRNPVYALACSEDLWQKLLENPVDEMEGVMLNLFNNNIICKRFFEDWLIKTSESNQTKWSSKVNNSIDVISKVYGSHLPDISNIHDSKNLEIIQQLVLKNRYDKREMVQMWNSVSDRIDEGVVLQSDHVQLLQNLYLQLVTIDTSYREKLVLLCIKILINHIHKKVTDENIKLSLLDIIYQHFKECASEEFSTDLSELWPQFVKFSLRSLYLEPKMIEILTDCLPLVYKSHDQKLPIKSMYEMVLSHSKYLPVMFGQFTSAIKETIINLLLNIAERSDDCFESSHIRIFLGVYGASLSTADQRLLKLIHLYENRSVDLTQYKPFLFGQKALDFYSSQKYQTPLILREIKMADLLDCLDETTVYKSALNFPIYRKHIPSKVEDINKLKSSVDCYDPCFLLPVFNQLLQEGIIVNLKQFIKTNCLSYVFAALSSYVTDIRKTGYLILKKLYTLLEKATFPEAGELKYLFDLLTRSIETSNMKLCTVITVYLSRLAKILITPEDYMYRKLTTFLMLKPTLEFDKVPGFYRYFNSTELDQHQERIWILKLMVDGMRTSDDFSIYSTLQCFKLLQCHFTSCLSDLQTQSVILQVINAACLDCENVISLYEKNTLLSWIIEALYDLSPGSCHVDLFSSIIYNFWFTLHKTFPDDKSKIDIPVLFFIQLINCIKYLLPLLGSDDVKSLNRLILTLKSAVHYLSIVKSFSDNEFYDLLPNNILIKDIVLVLLCVGKFHHKSKLFNEAESILNQLEIDTKLLLPTSSSGTKSREQKQDIETELSGLKISATDESIRSHPESSTDFKAAADCCDVSVSDLVNVILVWDVNSYMNYKDAAVNGFIMAMTYCLDNCLNVKDLVLKIDLLKWINSVVTSDDELAADCQQALVINKQSNFKVIEKLLYYYCNQDQLEREQSSDSASSNNSVSHLQLVQELNKLLVILVKCSVQNLDLQNRDMWKECLRHVDQITADVIDSDFIVAVFVQEYFMGVEHPSIFNKLYKTLSSTSTRPSTRPAVISARPTVTVQSDSMDTSDSEMASDNC